MSGVDWGSLAAAIIAVAGAATAYYKAHTANTALNDHLDTEHSDTSTPGAPDKT